MQRFGDLATWTGSIGTVAAFSVAYYQIHRERGHRLTREMADRHRARREHADRVSAWVAGQDLVVANHSGHPIHDVAVTLSAAPGPARGPASTDGGQSPEPVLLEMDHLVPGETRVPLSRPAGTRALPTLVFTDIRGDRWVREPGKPPSRDAAETVG